MLLITIPAPFSPTSTINNPIPAVIPYFRLAGTSLTSFSRKLVSERRTNTIPSISTAASAIFHGSLIPALAIGMQTEKEKYAFSPIPEASATG